MFLLEKALSFDGAFFISILVRFNQKHPNGGHKNGGQKSIINFGRDMLDLISDWDVN